LLEEQEDYRVHHGQHSGGGVSGFAMRGAYSRARPITLRSELPYPRHLDLKTTERFGEYTRGIYRLLGMD
jgi:hypothetical protein